MHLVVTRQDSIDAAIARVVEEAGKLDILINNAALFDLAPIVEITRASYNRLFTVNVAGTLFMLHAAARQMVAQGHGGRIINMASQAGRRGEALVAVCCATKAAVISLTQSALADLPAGVTGPAYDRTRLTPDIVHIGCGNSHRAHMAVYLDDLFGLGEGHDWAITGGGVRAGGARMREALAAQDWMSSVIELAPGARSARVIGAMTGFAEVGPGNAALIAAMADPAVRIVSLTVTKGGYYIDPRTGTFSHDYPDIRKDAANPDAPDTAFGAIAGALSARRAAGHAPFTVMCCDDVPHNGAVTRDAVTGLTRLHDPELADWIAANVVFPNSMVDRITRRPAPANAPWRPSLASTISPPSPASRSANG